MTTTGMDTEEDKQGYVVIRPKRGHHVINNGVIKIYRDIIKGFVNKIAINYFQGHSYMELVEKNLINEANRGGLPVDCVLRTAPLPHETVSGIESSTVNPRKDKKYTEDKNAEVFGQAKQVLLVKVHLIMREIFLSLIERKKMPDNLDVRMRELRQFIDHQFNREVFVDEQAKGLWQRGKGSADAEMLEKWTKEVEEMLRKIAGEGTIQLVIHWGQWAFRVSEGFTYDHFR